MPEFVTPAGTLALVGIFAYLVGSVPFGVVIARLFGLGDLRRIGSGNIGATNVLRTGNKLAAFLTLVLDAGKGGFAVLAARAFFAEDAAQLAGGAAFLGHLLPVWLGFRGGKGVATFLGTLVALAFPVGVVTCLTWLVTAFLFRISSLSALVAAGLSAVWAFVFGYAEGVFLIALMSALVIVRHGPNIRRILSGTEPRIGAGK